MAKGDVNLLPKQDVDLKEKTLKWALTSGRVIVVVTEFIVISAFLYRFVLDRHINDLNTNIEKNRLKIEESQETEKNIRLVQMQLTEADRILDKQYSRSEIVETVAQLRPSGVTFDSVTLSGSKLAIVASTSNTAAPAQFLQSLNEDAAFKNVTLTEVRFIGGRTEFQIAARVAWRKPDENV